MTLPLPAPDDEENKLVPAVASTPVAQPPSLWERIPMVWKAAGALITAAMLGGGAIAWGNNHVTKAELATHATDQKSVETKIEALTHALGSAQTEITTLKADITAVKATADATREDIRTLTKFLLERDPPPSRRRTDP